MKALIFCVLTLLFLAGCATNPTANKPPCANHYAAAIDSSLSGQANQFSGDLYDCQMRERMKTIASGALTGAAIGAGLGAIIGAATGLGAKTGALIGAGAGGLSGAAYGKFAADRDDAADKLTISEKALAILQQENQNLANFITQVKANIEDNQKKLAEIKHKYKQHRIKSAIAAQEVQQLNDTKTVLLSTVTNLKKRKEQATQSIPKDDEKFSAEMQRYNAQISQLEQIATQLPEYNLQVGG